MKADFQSEAITRELPKVDDCYFDHSPGDNCGSDIPEIKTADQRAVIGKIAMANFERLNSIHPVDPTKIFKVEP